MGWRLSALRVSFFKISAHTVHMYYNRDFILIGIDFWLQWNVSFVDMSVLYGLFVPGVLMWCTIFKTDKKYKNKEYREVFSRMIFVQLVQNQIHKHALLTSFCVTMLTLERYPCCHAAVPEKNPQTINEG